ncbi:MAG: UDP-N-acetylmuramate dehydrogenase [Thainema sp.]
MTLSFNPPDSRSSAKSAGKSPTSSPTASSPINGTESRFSSAPAITASSPAAPHIPGTHCELRSQVSLAGLTSLRIGGPAEWYLSPRRLDDVQAGIIWAREQQIPITFLGAGSNLLISDRGLPGLVIGMRHLRDISFDPETGQVTASAGVPIARLAWQAAERGWRGLEWAVGIPGTVGGAVVMNAGAHGAETANILVHTHVIQPDNQMTVLLPDELGFRYRTSSLQGQQQLVTQATFQLRPGFDPQAVLKDTTEDLNQRRTAQPYHLPSCGSVFRNPGSQAAGWFVEKTGLKGYQLGQAQVAQQHANFILNLGGATAADVFRLISHIQEQVEQRWSVQLKPEVKMLGDFSIA